MPEPVLRNVFATPVIEAVLDAMPDQIGTLKSTIQERRQTHPGQASRSNILGWHSDSKMIEWAGGPAQQLARSTLETCIGYTHDLGRAKDAGPRFEFGMEMWANVSPAGASNQMHAHPGSFWSAVFYVDDGGDLDEGQLVLLDPRFPTNRVAAPDIAMGEPPDPGQPLSQLLIRPEIGKVVIFPSWLMHAVRPHNGPRDRISIAMNILVRQVA
ncbi:TIGR02466 family protein [Marinicauda sp. Alg238-R41]|uniref:TIGR02466 family protein n=1 Tax=Marinicauda sp. Alg238-R41 TaxID=2993447 RepID=UPI0022E6DA5E|nr:TIGR02466 family protein [Marinicauda sp. Alg238-R41]